MNSNDFLARVEALMAKQELTARSLSLKAGHSADLVRNWQRAREAGKRWSPRVAAAQSVAHTLGVPVHDLYGGRAEDFDIQRVPLVAWISAGALATHDHVGDDALLGYCNAVGLPNGDWIAFRVEGSSMNRISPPESVIFVNRTERNLVPNACYVVADHDGSATYKRYRPDPPRLEPVSTEDAHAPIIVDNAPQVIGRVRRTVLDM